MARQTRAQDILERLAAGEVITNGDMQHALACHWMSLRDQLIADGKARAIPWITETVDGAIVRADLDIEQDPKDVERITKTVRAQVIEAWRCKVDEGGLPAKVFHRLGNRTGRQWKEAWLQRQLEDGRLVLEGDVYRPGPNW